MSSDESTRDASGPDAADGGKADDTESTVSGRRRPLVARVARIVATSALLGMCGVLVGWWASGGRWLIVRSPSMGSYAPVGTLVWERPANIHDIHVGQVITFRSPFSELTYTHRVVARDPDGTLQTKGDINAGRDPGHIDQRHLVGRVAAVWPGVGWLVRALPLLLIGGLAWWVLTGLLASRRSRAPLRVIGVALLVAAAIVVYKPLFGATKLSFIPEGPSGARATYVGTGLLPAEMHATGSLPVLLHSGQVRSIVATQHDHHGRYQVTVSWTTPWQAWAIIAAAGIAPAVWSVIVGVEPMRSRRRRRWRRRRPVPKPTPA